MFVYLYLFVCFSYNAKYTCVYYHFAAFFKVSLTIYLFVYLYLAYICKEIQVKCILLTCDLAFPLGNVCTCLIDKQI